MGGGGLAAAALVVLPGGAGQRLVSAIDSDTFSGWMDQETPADVSAKDALVQVSLELTVQNVTGYDNFGMVVTDKDIYMRKTASDKGDIVAVVPSDAGCDITGVEGDWTKVRSGSYEGYIESKYVIGGEDAIQHAREGNYIIATSNVNGLRIRSDASLEAKVVTRLQKGQQTEVIEVEDEWVKVSSGNKEGYAHSDYLEIEEELPEARKYVPPAATVSAGSNSSGQAVVSYAKQFVGNPYKYGGTSLTSGADCSGFTQSVYKKFGVSLSRTSAAQANNGRRVSLSDVRPGDLIFYDYGNGGISHVAIYIGDGQIIHAANSRSGIKISQMYHSTPVCATRVL